MKDREISRLVLLNIALLFAIILSGVFFFWLHGSVGSAPGGVAPVSVSNTPHSEPEMASTTAPTPISPLPAPESFKHFSYTDGMSIPVSGTCLATYIVVLIFPAAEDYRANSRSFVFDTAYPCVVGQVFSKMITSDMIRLSAGVSYYVVLADEKDSGTWYNPR